VLIREELQRYGQAYKDMDKSAIWAQIGALLTYPKTGIFIKKLLMSFEIMLECYY